MECTSKHSDFQALQYRRNCLLTDKEAKPISAIPTVLIRKLMMGTGRTTEVKLLKTMWEWLGFDRKVERVQAQKQLSFLDDNYFSVYKIEICFFLLLLINSLK